MINWFKKLSIPSGDKTEVVAYKSWVVRWRSLQNRIEFATEGKQEAEIFPSKEDAYKFAEALKESYRTLRYNTYLFNVTVEENQNKLASLSQ